MSLLKALPAMFKLMSMEDDLDAAAAYAKQVVGELGDLDGLKAKAVHLLEAIDAKSPEAESLIVELFDLIKSVADVDMTEDELKAVLAQVYAAGKLVYTLLDGDNTLSEVLKLAAAQLESSEASAE